MESLVKTPGLPDSKVTSVIVSCEYPAVITALNKLGIDTIIVPMKPDLEEAICSHPDCVYFQLDHKQIFLDKSLHNNIVNYLTSKQIINNYDLITIGESVKSPYPDDVRLNCKRISNKLFCNTKFISKDLYNAVSKSDINLIHVNQGYSACSTIVINDSALITDDESIHKASTRLKIDSLLVSKGSVQLKNHSYGFIGGACGMIDKNVLAFSGNIELHSDSDSIINFLNKYNIKYICLSDSKLTDIGGIIPLTQYNLTSH